MAIKRALLIGVSYLAYCSCLMATEQTGESHPLLDEPLFCVEYRLPANKKGIERKFLCWVSGNLVVSEAAKEWNDATGNKGGVIYLVPASGIAHQLSGDQTFNELVRREPYKTIMTAPHKQLTKANQYEFLTLDLFENFIATRYALIKKVSGQILTVPMNGLVRELEESELYKRGMCLGRTFLYNRALTDHRGIHKLTEYSLQLDKAQQRYSLRTGKQIKLKGHFITLMDWDVELQRWVLSTVPLDAPLEAVAEEKSQAQSPPPFEKHPNPKASKERHTIFPSHIPARCFLGICGPSDEAMKSASQLLPEGTPPRQPYYMFGGSIAASLSLGVFIGRGFVGKAQKDKNRRPAPYKQNTP